MSQPKTYSGKLLIGLVSIIIMLVILFVPIVPYSYQIEVPYQTTESRQVPYQEIQTMSSTVFTLSSYTLRPGHYVYIPSQISAGKDVSISWSADDTVSVMVFSSDQFKVYQNNPSNAVPIVSRSNVASGTLGFRVSATDTYYLVLYNPHTGFLGIGAHNVGIYNVNGTATWHEIVTKYRTETVTVTKWSTETKQVNISIFDLLTGRKPY
jgi:hypothetical protein